MKKVDIFIPYLSGYGGTEVVIRNLLREFHKRDSDFKIVVYSLGGFFKNNYLKSNDVKIIKFPNNKLIREFLYIFLLPLMIPYFVMKSKPDVFISTTPVMWAIAKIIFKLFHIRIPVVGWYQYSFNARNIKQFYLTKLDYFLTISNSGKHELLNKGISSNKIFVIYDPVIPTNNTINHSKEHNHFVYVGRIEYGNQKNLQEMFTALSKLHKPWTLDIYGKGKSTDMKKLILLSKKLYISKKICFKGFVENPFNHIKYADALLLTSNYEGFSMVIAEAISHGLYVISSDCPNGPSELVNCNNGNLYKMHDIQQLFNLLKNVINGKHIINHDVIKNSISKMYVNNYFKRFEYSINNIVKKNE